MKLRDDIKQRMGNKLVDNEYQNIMSAATLLSVPVNEVLDYSERNWEEDKFRFNDDEEVLEEVYIDFLQKDGEQALKNKTAILIRCKFSYLDLATAISLYQDGNSMDLPARVWDYVIDKSDLPEMASMDEPGFAEAEKTFTEFKPDFSNLDSQGEVGFWKDNIAKITEHLTELGYFPGRSV